MQSTALLSGDYLTHSCLSELAYTIRTEPNKGIYLIERGSYFLCALVSAIESIARALFSCLLFIPSHFSERALDCYKKNMNSLRGSRSAAYVAIRSVFQIQYGNIARKEIYNFLLKSKACSKFYDLYSPECRPNTNWKCLSNYVASDSFKKHSQSAKVYFNAGQMNPVDAQCVARQREPVNIAMNRHYDRKKLKQLYGYELSAYCDQEAVKQDGASFSKLPNTAGIYSETYLWSIPGEESTKKEIACLSIPAPALDSESQPHYGYYVQNSTLNLKRYRQEMEFLAKTAVQVFIDNRDSAFKGSGIKRFLLPRLGLGAFLGTLSAQDRQQAKEIFYQAFTEEISKNRQAFEGVDIAMVEYNPDYLDEMEKQFAEKLKARSNLKVYALIGDILKVAKEGDLINNAWDPHSAPGNGNDADISFDGAMGKGTGIGVTQNFHINPILKDVKAYIGVN